MQVELKNISKSFSKKDVIKNFSFTFKSSKRYGISGANGSGKTTLLKIISQLIIQDSGTINFSTVNPIAIYTSNNPRSFFMRLSCWDNLYYFGALNMLSKQETNDIIRKYFGKNDLMHFLENPVNKISLGQSQILSIMRCLLAKPNILLFDEMESNLDINNLHLIHLALDKYLRERNEAIVINTSHNKDFLSERTQEIINL
tara:strand:+ start:18795 stop:19397 length:603 start_codon:yes stop_codon:yes gene_type:complete